MDIVERLRGMSGFHGVGGMRNLATVTEAADEIERLRAALRTIAKPQYGLQGISEDYGHDANKFNFHAMEYWSKLCTRHARTARDAMFNSTGEV